MKRLLPFAVALWLGAALFPAQAAPPSQDDLRANPDALPMQSVWQLRPVDPQAPPWQDVFAFSLGMAPEQMARSRWLGLNTGADSERSPALFDALDGRAVFLSPAARGFCDGRWRVVRLERIDLDDSLQPSLKLWLVERAPDGAQRTALGYGRVDEQGRWTVPPKTCAGEDSALAASSAALPAPMPGEPAPPASGLRVDTVAGQPGLRDAQGRWRSPAPLRDIATAQWLRSRQAPVAASATALGLIDGRGRTVIPFVFEQLADAATPRRIRLCTAAGQDPQLDAATPRVCGWQRLRGGKAAALRPVQDPGTGRWGYQDARGRWAIAPQFRQARAFRHGYAVVAGPYPHDWRPPGWNDERPIVRKIQRVGRHWVAEAMVRNASTGADWSLRYGLLNDAGQWLAPVPDHALHIAVLFPPGGRSGFYAQMLAEHLPRLLGREVRVDYMPSATEDAYRQLMTQGGNAKVLLAALRLPRGGIQGVHSGQAIDRLMHALRPVTLLTSEPLVLAIDSAKADALGIHDTQGLLAYARAHPGALRIATGDDGWTGHLAFGQFRALSGVDVQRVIIAGMYPPSDIVTQAHAAELLFAPVNGVAVAVRRGQLRVIGTAAEPAHPQVFDGASWPTLASSAPLADFTAYDRFSLWAPANSDAASERRLQQAVAQVLALPSVQKQLQDLQVVAGGGSPDALLALEHEERQRWERAISVPASESPPTP
ncbi:Tripartite-type tricarboxylate transporter, receptor component TctC [Lysobacter sp. yr284]|uniref:tripartite tricarboxylate transporter substrate-binding protein n=1 Tax=Lysobacter sp. yr284 TaxID=1761791 RepID=UPI00089BB5CC|nr:tripartite tricarboxylate transporter substrate-binding protein [Lysobacter sp. yr284]SDY30493.1 Tripartite-type tricarboxylate transporter, receptor component TctC [Lysobacter sp. yr284]